MGMHLLNLTGSEACVCVFFNVLLIFWSVEALIANEILT